MITQHVSLLVNILTRLGLPRANMLLCGKQKSKLQRAASLKGLEAIHGSKENLDQSTSPGSFLMCLASGTETHINNLNCKLHNEHQKLSHAESSKAALLTKASNTEMELADTQENIECVTAQNNLLKRKYHASFMHDYHAPKKQYKEAEKSKAHYLKEKGSITDSSWEMTQELVAECSVPVTQVNKVIWTVTKGLGITIKDTVDKYSVSRILLEG